jgi:PKHD-type hydroxylase
MLTRIGQVLGPAEVERCRSALLAAPWVDGKVTAGHQSAKAKANIQIPEDHPIAREIGELILAALGRSQAFLSAALPLKVFPPLFNRYDEGMGFGAHVDNAIRFVGATPGRVRTDLAVTLFLTDPEAYDGGELVIEDAFGEHSVKDAAGSLVVYPASSLHRIEPVRRGSRLASFFWVQSMVRRDDQRTLLHRLDADTIAASAALGDQHPTVLSLTAGYHNLLRMWADS